MEVRGMEVGKVREVEVKVKVGGGGKIPVVHKG